MMTHELEIGGSYCDRFGNQHRIKDINNERVAFTVTMPTDMGETARSEQYESEKTFARRMVARVG